MVDLLLKKYVMKQSGILPSRPQKKEAQIGFLGCRITRGASGAIFCDQEKYILHCMCENYFIGEQLPDEALPEAMKRKYVLECQKYMGQLMWLATRTRPDTSGMGPETSEFRVPQGVQIGSEMAMRIRQEGESADGQSSCPERPEFHIHTYTDASFSTSGGRSRSGFLVQNGHQGSHAKDTDED